MTWILVLFAIPTATVAISFLVEALHPQPEPPSHLSWAPSILIDYVEVDGVRLRYVVTGSGPVLVFLHTLRTQLDMFQKILPALSARFQIYALDYPGHGYSDIPDTAYTAEYFVMMVAHALDRLDIQNATLVGESIGGSIALLLAARHNPRVQRVIAINPYDYDRGRGIRRSSVLANALFGVNNVPVLGATVNRLRLYPIVKQVFKGGLFRKDTLPPALARDMYRVGNRRGHYKAFMSLVRHWASWDEARAEYRHIDRPTLLLYGEYDWSSDDERSANAAAIPGVKLRVIKKAGHFLSLDAPEDLMGAIRAWVPVRAPAAATRTTDL